VKSRKVDGWHYFVSADLSWKCSCCKEHFDKEGTSLTCCVVEIGSGTFTNKDKQTRIPHRATKADWDQIQADVNAEFNRIFPGAGP